MNAKSSLFTKNRTLNCRGRLLQLNSPLVMGILNLTPDSFFDGGKYNSTDAALDHAEHMLEEGADIIDLGAYSSRPGAEHISEDEELNRLLPPLETIVKELPEALISIDTFRANVAEKAMEIGAHIINDISGGNLDEELPKVAARCNAPYICMHMKGTPQTMQKGLKEKPIVPEVLSFFAQRVPELTRIGVNDVIIDPGFGFGKTFDQNYEMVERLSDFAILGKPILAGISRKSMIRLKYGDSEAQTLKGTIEVHRKLIQNGADILRVHDVKETVELIKES
ncbi:MAG: dihydropteroate synthase [Flavobacteriales bacterium]|nr:dihydropteroate synthase [Flavobacteriales bacterium]